MVHVLCQNKTCKMIIHLDDATYWNYKGEIKCAKCGSIMYVEIRDGQAGSAKKIR